MIAEPIKVVIAGILLKNSHPNRTAHTMLTDENGCRRLAGAIVNAFIRVEWPATPKIARIENLSSHKISRDSQKNGRNPVKMTKPIVPVKRVVRSAPSY